MIRVSNFPNWKLVEKITYKISRVQDLQNGVNKQATIKINNEGIAVFFLHLKEVQREG